jgi:peptidyl-prolyl cis-trans isomerase SurA
MIDHFLRPLGLIVWLGLSVPAYVTPASAEGQGVIAVANDVAITGLDIDQRIALLKILGQDPPGGISRKKVLQELIDDEVKLNEAKAYKLDATDTQITAEITRMAKGMKTTPDELNARLAKQGVSAETFRKYVKVQLGFNTIIANKYKDQVKVNPTDVDKRFAEIQDEISGRTSKIMNDPRMKGITVYTIIEITLPVEGGDAADSGLLQARAVEAMQVARQFKSCGKARAAAEGVFNVKFGKPIEADASRFPPQMKSALDKAGVNHVVGPMRGKGGIQLLAFCGIRKITPQMPKFVPPTKQQVENMLLNERYNSYQDDYLKTARKKIYVEYRDPSYSQ